MNALAALIPLDKVLGVSPQLMRAPAHATRASADPRPMLVDCITHWGDILWLETTPLAFAPYMATTTITAFIVQNFLAYRACRLIPKTSIRIVTLCILIALTVVGTGCSIWTMVVLIGHPSYLESALVLKPALISLINSFVTTTTITCVFLSQMWRLRKQYNSNAIHSQLGGVIFRLSITAIETGGVSPDVIIHPRKALYL
ncbi:hypothetical protein RQP46_009082 [Phenoliferia psychrophenolica]